MGGASDVRAREAICMNRRKGVWDKVEHQGQHKMGGRVYDMISSR
jgi:hypothetical protein